MRFFRINDLADKSHLYVIAVDLDDMRRIVGDTCIEFGEPSRRLPKAEADRVVIIDELDAVAAALVTIKRWSPLFGTFLVALGECELGQMFFSSY